MKLLHFPFLLLIIGFAKPLMAQNTLKASFNLSDYHPHSDGRTDDYQSFQELFSAISKAGGGTATIPEGDYYLSGDIPIKLPSNTTIFAYGAKFVLPKKLGDQARIVLFQGYDTLNFSWLGGHFEGYCFDHLDQPNTWEPNVTTRIFVINTSEYGKTENILFRDISSNKIAGAIVNIEGYKKNHKVAKVENFAHNITVENCTFIDSGKFMWDYGLLWQIIVFSEDYTSEMVAMAQKYFRNDLIYEDISMKNGDDKIHFKKENKSISISSSNSRDQAVCFYNDVLPENIIKGKQYFVIESNDKYFRISDSYDGVPIKFKGSSGPATKIIVNLSQAFMGLYAPKNFGPGKGAIDLVACKNTLITDCKISALGDAMHIYSCHNNIFSNNQILGARMGAFFLAEYSKNSTIIGNTVDGTNGSRVMSIERSNEDVLVMGNTFRNGGRGSWINQPINLVIQGNIFINNTTKGSMDPWRGRRTFKTGLPQQFAEMYFTTYEKGSSYGPIILKDNIFTTGPEADAAIHFEKNGTNILVEGNIFKGHTNVISKDLRDETIRIENNIGSKVINREQISESKYKN